MKKTKYLSPKKLAHAKMIIREHEITPKEVDALQNKIGFKRTLEFFSNFSSGGCARCAMRSIKKDKK